MKDGLETMTSSREFKFSLMAKPLMENGTILKAHGRSVVTGYRHGLAAIVD